MKLKTFEVSYGTNQTMAVDRSKFRKYGKGVACNPKIPSMPSLPELPSAARPVKVQLRMTEQDGELVPEVDNTGQVVVDRWLYQ